MMLHDVGQMQIHAAVQAVNTGYLEIEQMVEELANYVMMTETFPSRQQNRSFALMLIIIMRMDTSLRWTSLVHFTESHGMELYK